jgi:hypothetical protein
MLIAFAATQRPYRDHYRMLHPTENQRAAKAA